MPRPVQTESGAFAILSHMGRYEALIDRLKLVGAALFVVAGVFGGVFVALSLPRSYPAWLVNSIPLCALLVFLVIAVVLFNSSVIRSAVPGEKIRKLEAQGLVRSQPYRALRAFQIQEFEDEGSHYYIELDDRRVLFLSGQYLWDHDVEDQPRTFPCTEFVVRRHATKGYALDVLCGGAVIEPDVIAPPFDADDFGTEVIPADGQIITDRPYDRLKHERMSRVRTPTL
jgi:hypothetical protein